ncbi:MAG: lipopolysaccharide biosynthesis protein [Hyphomicrobiales bacterium]
MRKLLPEPIGRLVDKLLKGEGERAQAGRGALAAFIIRIASAGIAFLSQVVLARWLGAFEFGVFSYAWIWVTVLGTLCTLGFAVSVVRCLPEYASRGEIARIRGFLAFGRGLCFGAGVLVMIAGAAILYFGPGLVGRDYALPLAIALICLPAFAVTDFQDGVGRSQGWMDLALVPPYVLRPLLLLAFVLAAGWIGDQHDATTAMLCAAVATWLVAGLQYLLQRRRFRPILGNGTREMLSRTWLWLSLSLLLLETLSLLLLNLDLILLNFFVSPDQLGIYFAATRTISLVAFIHFAVTAVAMPRFADLHAAGRSAEIGPLLSEMQRWCVLPSLIGAVILLLLGKPLLWLFGPGFTAAYPVMFILAIGYVIRAFGGPAQSLLMATGHHNRATGILMATVALSGALNLGLIPWLGITGAAIATTCALSFEAIASFLLARRLFPPRGQAEAGKSRGPVAS